MQALYIQLSVCLANVSFFYNAISPCMNKGAA